MAKRDYYDVLAWREPPAIRRSRPPFAVSPRSIIRIAATATRPPRRASRKSTRPTRPLKDPQKRAAYDRFGHAAFENGVGGRPPRLRRRFLRLHVGHVRRSVRRVHGPAAAAPALGASAARTCATTWRSRSAEAYRGQDRADPRADQRHLRGCARARRQGGHRANDLPPAAAGKVRASQGFFTIERTCPSCGGAARSSRRPALLHRRGPRHPRTDAVGHHPGGRRGRDAHPARRRRRGGLRGGPAGDLYIFLSIKPHEFFQRDGADLFCRVPIAMTTAALGGEIEVPTIDGGKTKVKIPEGTEGGKQFRLKGKGMPVLRSGSRATSISKSRSRRRRASRGSSASCSRNSRPPRARARARPRPDSSPA